MTALAQEHDCLLLDLDGTVFRGQQATVGAVETLAAIEARTLYVTNNASRSPAEVAQHLVDLGFTAQPDDVATSAQSAARLLAAQLPTGSAVLVVGTEALAADVRAVGLRPVRQFSDDPVAVVQGHSPQTGWADLAEAALAIRGGALWVAANVDRTLPSERGLLPGNGAMVEALRITTDREPQVAGKPEPTLLTDALHRGHFASPLVVGDRLDTDIAGANAADLPSLMVLTGVSTAAEMVFAFPEQRPKYVAPDLRSLLAPSSDVRVGPHPAWDVEVGHDGVVVKWTGGETQDSLTVVRATADAIWSAGWKGRPPAIVADDATARQALERWSLLHGAID